MSNTNLAAVDRENGLSVTVRLASLASDIRMQHQKFQVSVIQIGLDLIEAKSICQHGEWLPWLQELGMSHTQADNYMRYAKEVPQDSWLQDLPYAKGLALLGLPEEDRRAFADEHKVDDKSAAEIKRLVAAEKKAREDAKKSQEELAAARIQMEKLAVEARNPKIEVREVVPEDYESLKVQNRKLQEKANMAETAACEAEEKAAQAVEDAQRLRMQIADQEDEAPGMGSSRGLSLDDLMATCNAFSSKVWAVPFMTDLFRQADASQRQGYRLIAEGILSWAQRTIDAIDAAMRPIDVTEVSFDG